MPHRRIRNRLWLSGALSVCIVLACQLYSTAQVLPNKPTLEQVQNTLRPQPIDTKKIPNYSPLKKRAANGKVITQEESVGKQTQQQRTRQNFVINVSDIEVNGVTAFSKRTIEKIVLPYEQSQMGIENFKSLIKELKALYHDKGLYTTNVVIPNQDFKNGLLKVQVMEGKVGDVIVQNNKRFKAMAIKRDVGISQGDLMNLKELSDTLKRLNKQGKYWIKSEIKNTDSSDKKDLVINVYEKHPWQITPSFDNQGRPFIGTYRWGVGVQNKNLTGMGDNLYTNWTSSVGTHSTSASYNIPITKYGTELGYNYSFSYSNIDLEIPQRAYEGYGNIHSIKLSQPLNKKRTLIGDVAFNAKRSSTRYGGNQISHEDVRSLTAGVNYSRQGKRSGDFARVQMDFAPDWLSSNRQFWKTNGTYSHWHLLPKNNLLLVRANMQMTPDALPGVESYQLGGAYTVPGYTEGVLSGHRGYNLGIEHRWPVPGLRKISPWLSDRVKGATTFAMGQIWTDSSSPNYVYPVNASSRNTLAGIAVGTRVNLNRYLTGFVDLGWGLTNQHNVEANAQPDMRVHFGITSNLLPDGYIKQKTETNKVKKAAKTKNTQISFEDRQEKIKKKVLEEIYATAAVKDIDYSSGKPLVHFPNQ